MVNSCELPATSESSGIHGWAVLGGILSSNPKVQYYLILVAFLRIPSGSVTKVLRVDEAGISSRT